MSVNREVRFTQTGACGGARKLCRTEICPLEQVELTAGREGALKGAFVVPKTIVAQLKARQSEWPLRWTTEDYQTTWLAPGRLLLFPNRKMRRGLQSRSMASR